MSERSIFIAALEKDDPLDRAGYLDQACAGDLLLRSRIERLLEAHEPADSFLEGGPAILNPTDNYDPVAASPGTVIGPYKLIEQLGEGGMGSVWMAQQTEPVKRLVAVKLIKAGMDSRQVIARFEAERQALALMDHPNIARVLDGGTTSGGRPYFVMDLVKGMPITRYCDEHHLTPRQRLELFIPVCQAVQHAHQKGIIHRDLKPSNVLVAVYDDKPVPKVIDFGVAKAAGLQLTDKTLVTGFGAIVGTLEYMSPEQAEINQLDIDTRSDIYSLGVLLYELLAGSPPFSRKELTQVGVLEMLRVIREQEPSKPSTKLSTAEGLPTLAANRGTEPARLAKLVRGELDWIVMKALDKDRNRRYETANGFAMDVERYLADEPVLACPPSAGYRLRKFARKHKAGITVALGVSGLLVTAVVLLAIGNYRIAHERMIAEREHQLAEANLRKARRAVDTMFTDVAVNWLGRRVQLEPLQQKFLGEALTFYTDLAMHEGSSPDLHLEAANAYRRMALINIKLGNTEQGKTAFEKSIGLLVQPITEPPFELTHRVALAETYHDYGRALIQTQPSHAEKLFRQALSHREKLTAEFPGAPQYRRDLAYSLAGLGSALHGLRQYVESERLFRRALELMGALPAHLAGEPASRSRLAEIHADFVYTLGALDSQGNTREVLEEFARARAIYEQLVVEFPLDPEYLSELAWVCRDQVYWLSATRPQEALSSILTSIALAERLIAASPSVPGYRNVLGLFHQDLGNLLRKMGRYEEAESALRKSVILLQEALSRFSVNFKTLGRLLKSYTSLADLLKDRAQPQVAEKIIDQAQQFQEKITAKAIAERNEVINRDPKSAAAHYDLGVALIANGDLDGAERDFREADRLDGEHREQLENGRGSGDEKHRLLASWCESWASCLTEARRFKEAEEVQRRAIALWERLATDSPKTPEYRLEFGHSLWHLSILHGAVGQNSEVEKNQRKALEVFERLATDFPNEPYYQVEAGWSCLVMLGPFLEAQPGRRKDAEQILRRGLAIHEKLVTDSPKRDLEIRRRLASNYDSLVNVLKADGRVQDALKVCGQAVDFYARLVTNVPDEPAFRLALADARKRLATIQSSTPVARALDHIRLSQWDKAAAEYAKADLLAEPLRDDDFAYACLFLIRGSSDGFNQFCQGMIKRAARTGEHFEAFVLARTCGMAGKTPVDPARAVQWANQALAGAQHPWYLHALGLAQYRAGQFDQALQSFTKADSKEWTYRELNWFGLALVHHRLGHPDLARQCLDKGMEWLVREGPPRPGQPTNINACDWLAAQVLRREAEETLKIKRIP